jgi:AcrR family transcriptional regulator
MIESEVDIARRKGYHHGNLEDALIEAARRLVAEKGPVGFTLADAARLAGVTPAAVYRHFADRTALLCALAGRGFGFFNEALKQGLALGKDPNDAMQQMGVAYLDFARREPGYYSAMFAAGLKTTDLDHSAPDAFQTLITGLMAAVPLPPERALPLAMQIWSLAHGTAMLEATGAFNETMSTISAEKALSLGTAALIKSAAANL